MHFSTQCSLFRDAIALKLHAILFNLVFPCKAAVRSQYNKVRKICETWSTQNLFDLKSYVIKNIVNDLNNSNNCLYILNEDDYEEPPNLDQFIQQQQQQQQQPPVYRSQYEYVYNAPLAPQSSSQRQPPPPQSHQSHAQSQSQYAPLDSVASMHMNRDTTRYDNNSHSYNQHHRQQNQSAPYYDQYSSSASRGAYQNRNRINTHNAYQPRYTHNTSTSDAYHNNNNNNNNNIDSKLDDWWSTIPNHNQNDEMSLMDSAHHQNINGNQLQQQQQQTATDNPFAIGIDLGGSSTGYTDAMNASMSGGQARKLKQKPTAVVPNADPFMDLLNFN